MPSRRRRKKKLETDSESPANKRLRLDVTNQRATQPNVNNPQNNANNIDESTVAPIETELESNVNDPSIAQSNVDVSTVDPQNNVDVSTVDPQNNVDVSTVDPQNNVDVSTVDPQNNVDVSTVDPMETDEKTSFSRDWFEQNPGSDCFPNIIMEEAKMNEDIKHLCVKRIAQMARKSWVFGELFEGKDDTERRRYPSFTQLLTGKLTKSLSHRFNVLSGFGATQFKVQNASIANALKLSPSESSSLTTLKKLINISSVLERFRLGKIVQNSNLNGGKCMFIKRPINLNSLEPEVVVGLGTLGIPPSSYVQSYNKPNIVIWKKRDWIKKFPEDFASKVTEMTADYDNLEYRGTDIVSYLNAWDEQLPFKTIDEAKLIIDGLEAFMKEQKLIERKIRPNYNVDLNAKSLRNHYTDLRKIHLEHIINIHNLMRDDEIDQMTKRFNGLNASDIKPIDWFGSNKREKKCENKLLKCDKIPAHWKHDYKDSNK
eukprot:377674_1